MKIEDLVKMTIPSPVASIAKKYQIGTATVRGRERNFAWRAANADAQRRNANPLRDFFYSRSEGRGIWKWDHYFDIYDRHFHQFRGQKVNVLEIGIYSGGSLEMWREYFGPQAQIYGADIEPACRAYEGDGIKIFIGDQADRSFWRGFRNSVPALDIVIDDGGHEVEQQIASFEELVPFLRPGGIYLCEDVHGAGNGFASYVHGLAHKLNDYSQRKDCVDDSDRRIICECTPFQMAVASIHLYPYVTVIERNSAAVKEFKAPKRGTQWQPFFK